jgi:hypothetical protein
MNRKMQGKRLTTMLAAGLLTMAAASSAYAYPGSGLIAEWDTTGLGGKEASLAGTSSIAQISGLTLSRGPGLLTSSTGANSMNSNGWDGTNSNDYFEFTLTVDSGFEATLGDLWIGTKSSSTGPGTMGFYSSTDNYSNEFYTVIQDGIKYKNDTIDLSFLGPISGSFSIRLSEIGNTQAGSADATASGGTFRVTDYTFTNPDNSKTYYNIGISGTVAPVSAVPVPAAAWLLGSGLLGLVGLKRKRQ